MKAEPIVIERVFDAHVDKVWQAITDKQQMKEWYFDFKEFIPEVGFQFTWHGGDEKQQWLHAGTIREVIPGKKLSYSWSYPGYSGESLVSFELFPEGNKTKLRLTHSGIETFPADMDAFKKENFVAGWTAIIGSLLKNYLEKEKEPAKN
jgi:uncharacterized protein YndB with AHSA1/START domain